MFCNIRRIRRNESKTRICKIRPGYYGIWAKYRTLSVDEAIQKVKAGIPWVVRFKSMGQEDRKIKHHDLIKGNIEFPENDQDIVIIKADGLPTYHLHMLLMIT